MMVRAHVYIGTANSMNGSALLIPNNFRRGDEA